MKRNEKKKPNRSGNAYNKYTCQALHLRVRRFVSMIRMCVKIAFICLTDECWAE